MRRRRLALLGVLVTALAAAGPVTAPAAVTRTSLPVIERQVMCVTCKIPLDVAQSAQADRERAYIQSLIDEGETEAQIKNALVGQYGPAVLGLPGEHGFDLAAYLVPLAVLLCADHRCSCCCYPAGATPAPRSAGEPAAGRRSTPAMPRAWTRTSRVSTSYISSGALTPSRSRQDAIVRPLATHSAMRRDSTLSGSAPTTRQSR